MRERAREVQRLEKLLEDAGIKLPSVATDITGACGRAMLEALIGGENDPEVLADLAKHRLRSKIPALTEALAGRFRAHHGFLCRLHLDPDRQLRPRRGPFQKARPRAGKAPSARPARQMGYEVTLQPLLATA